MRFWTALGLGGALLLIGLSSAAVAQTSSPLLTTSLTPSAAIWTTFQSQRAVNVNYTSSSSQSFSPAIVYLTVENSLGQAVGVFISTASIPAGGNAPVYLIVFGLPHGQYTGLVFAATSTGIPISTESTVSLSV